MTQPDTQRPVALVTGVGRTVGIGAGIARRLAASGWDIAFTYWTPYDERMDWGVESGATDAITKDTDRARRDRGRRSRRTSPTRRRRRAIFDEAEERLGTSPRW